MSTVEIPAFSVTVDTTLPPHADLGRVMDVTYDYAPNKPAESGPIVFLRLNEPLPDGEWIVTIQANPFGGVSVRSMQSGQNVDMPPAAKEQCAEIWAAVERCYRHAVLRAFFPVAAQALSVEFMHPDYDA